MNKRTLWISLGIFAAIALGAGHYLSATSSQANISASVAAPSAPQDQMAGDMASSSPSVASSDQNGDVPAAAASDSASKKEFTVTGQNFSFAPSTLTVNKGDTVTITFKNVEGFHDFRIDEFGVATKKISGGKEEAVTFVADKTGTFEYYCSVGSHRAMGMKGTLTVQ